MEAIREWEDLPDEMKNDKVRPYYEKLKSKKKDLERKRIFDIVMASILLTVALPLLIIIAVAVVLDSRGGVLFCQERVTAYGKSFKILKFRTMVKDAHKLGTAVTVSSDKRVTKVGAFLRKYRLDELPQLINIIWGDMSFVGTRPESPKYVNEYSDEMYATLLLPAGVTSSACIEYKDEEKLLINEEDADRVYIQEILPQKMRYNLNDINEFSMIRELKIIGKTILAVLR
ncbi:MAG: sugar transferase [Lachnospiraceae bacterium]|nr:sugar transferase [Lachnospiraceae bacterium]